MFKEQFGSHMVEIHIQIVKYISLHHMCTYLSHFCNYIVITYATSLTTNLCYHMVAHLWPCQLMIVCTKKCPMHQWSSSDWGFTYYHYNCTYDYGILLHVTNNPMTNMKPCAPMPRLYHVAHKLSLCLSY
jgi:hypothetical protein